MKTIDEKHILYGKKDKRIVALEDMYDTCMEIHKKAGYQGRETISLAEAKIFYGNVTRPIVELFLNFSEEYQLKRVNVKNNCIIAKPIKSTQFNQRWQIDLIDFRTCPDGEFNWIMTVKDHFTKFVWLKPLEGSFTIEKIPKVIDKKTGKETEEYVKLGLREAVRQLSVGTGQGFIKCSCNINAKCSTSRCSCKAA